MLSFTLVEKSEARIHIIHSLADDRIPFCPYFIIPYVLWYFFLIGTIVYFALFCSSKKEYYQYIGTLAVGMTLIYPGLLCVSKWTESSSGSERGERSFCFRQCDICTK